MMPQHSRRQILKGGLVGASLAGLSPFLTYSRLSAQEEGDSLENVLNVAATAEMLACTHYYTALTDSGIQLIPSERKSLLAILDSEYAHLRLLTEKGAESISTRFYTPRNVYNDRTTFAAITEQAETAFIATYLAANRRIAELGDPLLAATIAQIATSESVHLALIRQLGGLLPNNVSMGEALYYTPSEVLPVLRPFLVGGQGFASARPYPGDEAIQSLVGSEGVQVVPPFTDLTTSGSNE